MSERFNHNRVLKETIEGPVAKVDSDKGGRRTSCIKNIARGTTDPEIDSVTGIKFSNNMSLLALVAYFATRWRHLHKFQNLTTRWRILHWL